MAQLWASHAHDGKSPIVSANTRMTLFVCLSLCIFQLLKGTSDILSLFVMMSVCPKPRRLVPLLLIAYTSGILFHFCLSAGGSAPGSVLYASRFLLACHYCNPSSPRLFSVELSVQMPFCLYLQLSCPTLPQPSPDLASEFEKCISMCAFRPLRLCCFSSGLLSK